MRHTFSIGDRSGLQAGQSSTRTLFLRSQGLCNVCRMWFCIVLLKYAWASLEKMSSWRQHIVLQNLYVLFIINGAITEVQVTFAKGTDTTPYHDRPWLLDLLLVTVWMILFFFGPEHTASLRPCPLRTEIPPDSLNLLIMLCTVEGEISKSLFFEEHCF